MKTFKLLFFFSIFAIVLVSLTFIVSCSKENESKPALSNTLEFSSQSSMVDVDEIMLNAYRQHIGNGNKGPVQWWKWLVAHSGVGPYWVNGLPVHCGFNLPCGECPGFCAVAISKGDANLTPVNSDYLVNDKNYEDGERLIQMAYYSDSLFGITFIHRDLTYYDTLYVMEEFYIGDAASELFNKDSVIILPGIYPLTYSHSDNGSSVIRVRTYND